jgi:DNA ligase-1
MNRFAALLDRLAYEHGRNAKIRLMTEHFRSTPDPDRGFALAALTGALTFRHAKPNLIHGLIAERTDPVLFGLSYDYVGDLSETVALLWPTPRRGDAQALPQTLPVPSPAARSPHGAQAECGGPDFASLHPGYDRSPPPGAQSAPSSPASGGAGARRTPGDQSQAPTLAEVVTALATLGKTELPARLAHWLDALDETGRWALLKLVTGALRIGVSARLAKTAVAALGDKDPDEIELIWPGLAPPYLDLFAWIEGRGPKPETGDPAPFRPVMLAHAIEEPELRTLDPADYMAEFKWDGIRVQAVAGERADGLRAARLYSRTGEDISGAFPDLVDALRFTGAIDGELLIRRDGRVQPYGVLQQRLNRKTVSPKLIAEYPAHLRAYDLLALDDEDLRARPFPERRARLEERVSRLDDARIDLSPLIAFTAWEELIAVRADPVIAGGDADAVEGVMLKRRDAPYLPGRPKGYWWKWKRDPFMVDAVLMYAQRGSGKRSSFYSDYTFGVWRTGPDGDELVPVGKSYFGFTDTELAEIDRFVRRNTVDRFGPVREVVHTPDRGLVLEVAFEGLQRSTRHKSGLAMRFPRINRLRWDKPPAEADRLETLERMLADFAGRGHGARGAARDE